MRPFQGLSLAVLLAAFTGCGGDGEQLLKTYPVTGKAFDAAGKPMTEGTVHFRHATDAALTINGPIGKTGSFTLKTYQGRWTHDGAPEGDYQALIFPPIPKGQQVAPLPITIPQTFHVVVEKENNFELRPGPR
jgi:hypothetical protein